jgi:prepilin-type N-terminal cleavage/methylation domain-containing protein
MRGFTLTELLIVIGITLILAMAAIPIYGSLQVQSQLNENTTQIVQALRTARERSVARLNDAPHGVYLDVVASAKDKYILYQGSSYATRNASYDREVILDDPLIIVNSSFTLTSGDIDINFSEGLGVPDNTGSFILSHEVSGSKNISVNSLGKTEEN